MSRALARRIQRLERGPVGPRGRQRILELMDEMVTRSLLDPEYAEALVRDYPGRPGSEEAKINAELIELGFEPVI